MSNKLSNKDKKDWQDFLESNEKVLNKDLNNINNRFIKEKVIKKIDLHGFSLKEANLVLEKYINDCYNKKVDKIIVITGKGLRSKNIANPFVSKDLSILRYSVPEFVKNNESLIKIVKEIKSAEMEDGGQGAFYIFLKNK